MSEGRRGTDTRARMLEVAGRQFAAKGYEGAHLESIAREVGVRKTALYYYFENKEDLYVSVLEDMLIEFERTLSKAWDAKRPKIDSLRRGAEALNDVLADNPTFAQILIRICVDRIPIDPARIRPYLDRFIQTSVGFFESGVQEGVFRPLSGAHVLQSALGTAIFHYAGGAFSASLLGVEDVHDPQAVEERRRQVVDLMLHGVLAPEDGD